MQEQLILGNIVQRTGRSQTQQGNIFPAPMLRQEDEAPLIGQILLATRFHFEY